VQRHLGAHVIGTARSARHDWLAGLGAGQLVDYTAVAFEDVLADVDVVLDLAGDGRDNTSTRSLTVLRPAGCSSPYPAACHRNWRPRPRRPGYAPRPSSSNPTAPR